jgi:hypothetical protein
LVNESRVNEYPSQYDGLRQQLNEQRSGYNQWPPKQLNVPTALPVPVVRLSDEDVVRIAEAVVRALKAGA